MLQNFIICVNAVVPAAIYLTIGIILKFAHVVSDEEVKKFTHMVFVTLYPFIMFDNLYGRNIGDQMNLLLIVYAVGFTVFQLAASWIIVCRIEKDNYNRGAMIQALYRSNYVLMGLPIAINLFGKANVAPIAVIMIFVVPLYNMSAVVIFETFRGGKVNLRHMAYKVLTNPIIVGAIVACVFIIPDIKLPEVIMNTVSTLSDCTSPIALILLGASLNLKDFTSDRSKVAFCTAGKLIAFPALGIGGAVMLGFTGNQLIALTLMVSAPDALASYAMASSMGGNGSLAGEGVVISTIASCFTIPIWLFILKTAGLF